MNKLLLASLLFSLGGVVVETALAAENVPEQRWGKKVDVESPRGGENAESDLACIVAPPGYKIAIDRLDVSQQCGCNESAADPSANCPIKFEANTPARVCYRAIARPTANNSQRCNNHVTIGYFLVKE